MLLPRSLPRDLSLTPAMDSPSKLRVQGAARATRRLRVHRAKLGADPQLAPLALRHAPHNPPIGYNEARGSEGEKTQACERGDEEEG
ncbi:unnamed protein product [Prorocentrum cordatum]|uniref:Uncharacterized protein n=1 Tax=Prorocentrum cordatum TaxID=2364126 RepID=A0ABN9W1G6_9DINO|nr:unnamed protein product [Polarella glacialis]